MFNPISNDIRELTDEQIKNKIRTITQNYYHTNNVSLRFQLSDLLEDLVSEQTNRLAKNSVDNNESFDGLISVN